MGPSGRACLVLLANRILANNFVRINIVASGRFHVLDLARELVELGHDVKFYSYVPRRRAEQFGLPAKCHRGLLSFVFPLVALAQRGPKVWRGIADKWLLWCIDHLVACTMEPCEVFIGMSGLCVVSALAARRRFGAKIFLERGSRHILSQKDILEAIPGTQHPAVSADNARRELQGYELADVIVIPSHHAEQSFLERGTPPGKLFRNPYGVDLTMFPPMDKPANGVPTVLMVGTWSLRKGCDVLWEACRTANSWRLLHVGPLDDAPLPRSPLFTHRDSVPQWQLAEQFKQADVFVLASREEGLSLVQAQALACGLPVVCTDRTGGEDLREMLADPAWVTVVPNDDAAALRQGIERALALANKQVGVRDILGQARERLSWKAYAARYHDKLVAERETSDGSGIERVVLER